MDKINVYINSKNRDLSERISSFTVRIPQNLLRLEQGEYFTLNVNGFIAIIAGSIVLMDLIMNFILLLKILIMKLLKLINIV